jgi:hypothetical protein
MLVLKLNPLELGSILFFLNSHTLVILLQVDPTFGDKPEIVCEGCYKTKDTSIFTWSSVLSIRHYRWLHGLICQLPPNSKQTTFFAPFVIF